VQFKLLIKLTHYIGYKLYLYPPSGPHRAWNGKLYFTFVSHPLYQSTDVLYASSSACYSY